MRNALHDVWGSARGPSKSLAPPTRLVLGAALFAACLISPAATVSGSGAAAIMTAGWLVACRVPFRVLRATFLLGLAVFLPYFLLVPLLPDAPALTAGSFRRALAVPWGVLVHGMTGMLVSVATTASLSASDLREAFVRLPLPGAVSAILLQIVHQSGTLFYETRRVAEAMAVRGATGGASTGWRVLASLPRAWLPRVADRAERVADAMELRGFGLEELGPFRAARFSSADAAALAAAAAVLAGAVALRLLEDA